ncbi:hypothetical protein [Glaciecola sp. 1036]|uniref:hypothetical protein n=1 Tax=Alteromonadaceae TaxID=72275 RepID=UPI003D02C0CC
MKLSTTIAATALTLATMTASANTVVFKPLDSAFETQACQIAGAQGLEAAKTFIVNQGESYRRFLVSVTCNGVSISTFAKMHKAAKEEKVQQVALVAKTNTVESQLCMDAVIMGEAQARAKHDVLEAPVLCNDKPLTKFVEKFAKADVVLKDSAE